MHHAVANFGGTAVEVVLNRVAVVAAVGFGGEGGVAERRETVAVYLRRGVRGDQNALLFRQMRDP